MWIVIKQHVIVDMSYMHTNHNQPSFRLCKIDCFLSPFFKDTDAVFKSEANTTQGTFSNTR